MIVLDVFAFGYKLRTPLLCAPLGGQILAGLCSKSPVNFIWMHLLFVEKAGDDSLLGAVQHFENSKRKEFSVQKVQSRDVELERRALGRDIE
jgi:hypothetical protein